MAMLANPLIRLLQTLRENGRTHSLHEFDEVEIRRCISRGLGPLLYLASKESVVVDNVHLLLRSADLTSRILIGQLTDAMSEILDALGHLKIPIVLLKGISICEEFYPEPHCRTMGDIDFLIPENVYGDVEACLMELGYCRRSHRVSGDWSDHHHGAPLFHAGRGVWVEIHTGLFPRSAPVSRDAVFAVSTVFAEARSSTFFQRPVQRLSPELQLIYITAHWAYDLSRHFGRDSAAIPLVDVIYLLSAAGEHLDWERVLGWSSNTLAGSYLFLMLSYLDKHGLASIPADVLRRLKKCQPVLRVPCLALLHRFLDQHVLGGSPYGRIMNEWSVSIVWRTLLYPGAWWWNMARVPWNLLFPPVEGGHIRLRRFWRRTLVRSQSEGSE